MSTITILYDGDGDDAVFMPGTLLPKIEAAFPNYLIFVTHVTQAGFSKFYI